MTLLDVAMAHAARSPLTLGGEHQPSVVTLEMKSTFVRPGQGRLVAEGRRLHRSATLAFCEAWVRDTAGVLVSHGTGTFKYMKALPVDGRKVQKPNASD
jgi:acyl-coenzyme A thioesterase PaaI-like protein